VLGLDLPGELDDVLILGRLLRGATMLPRQVLLYRDFVRLFLRPLERQGELTGRAAGLHYARSQGSPGRG
jgi:hypothetical protein